MPFLAKPAAHVRCHHADVVFGKVEDEGKVRAKHMWHLRRRPHGKRISYSFVAGQATTSLHRQRHVPTGDKTLSDDAVSLLECLGNLTNLRLQYLHDIVAPLLVHQG